MNIMNFKWQLINDSITKKDKKTLTDFINTDGVRFTNGEKVKEFEKRWTAAWLMCQHPEVAKAQLAKLEVLWKSPDDR